MNVIFQATQDFWSSELKSQYSAGQLYKIRPGNDLLRDLVEVWRREGKVQVLGAAPPNLPDINGGGE